MIQKADATSITEAPPQSPYLTEDEAATYCRVSRTRIVNWSRRHLIAYIPATGGRLYLQSDLDAFLQSLRVKARRPARNVRSTP